MKTNEIYLGSKGTGREDALREAEKYAAYQEITGKDKIHVRLLTEELISMLENIAGDFLAYFWIEDDNESYRLHLQLKLKLSPDIEKALLDSDKVESKSFKEKLKSIFGSYAGKNSVGVWSLSKYRASAAGVKEDLEKSIIANLADEVTVGIDGDNVEMVITKKRKNTNASPYESYIRQRITS